MTVLDRRLARWSIGVALKEVPDGSAVLDVGCGDGRLLLLGAARGTSHEEHHGFRVGEVVPRFEEAGFRPVRRRRFQLGPGKLSVFAPSR